MILVSSLLMMLRDLLMNSENLPTVSVTPYITLNYWTFPVDITGRKRSNMGQKCRKRMVTESKKWLRYTSSIAEAHQTPRRSSGLRTQRAVVQFVLCSTDVAAACSWADDRRRRRDVAAVERPAAKYDGCLCPLEICYRESQRPCV